MAKANESSMLLPMSVSKMTGTIGARSRTALGAAAVAVARSKSALGPVPGAGPLSAIAAAGDRRSALADNTRSSEWARTVVSGLPPGFSAT
jgi:hypothetical protein